MAANYALAGLTPPVHFVAGVIKDSTSLGSVLLAWQSNITAMVAMAKKADIRVLLGNLPANLLPQADPEGVSRIVWPVVLVLPYWSLAGSHRRVCITLTINIK